MTHYSFFKRDEIRIAKRELRKPVPIFGITCSPIDLKFYIGKYELEQDWIWIAN